VAQVSTADWTYDERQIQEQLEASSLTSCVAFAAACAEWLYPCYAAFAAEATQGDAALLRAALDTAWSLCDRHELSVDEVDRLRSNAEALVPDDDDEDWTALSPLAQNGAAAVAYALRTWLSKDAKEAVWAARQLYEAGDYLVQIGAPIHSYAQGGDLDEPLFVVLRAIQQALSVTSGAAVSSLRTQAVEGGKGLRKLVEQGAA
jgi:hypothetical protein